MTEKKKLHWEKLDNAALIFPASHRKTWSNVFRVSFSMKTEIDPDLLQVAVDHLAPRFPTVYARLRKSSFWYYMEEVSQPPLVQHDNAQPLTHMSREEFGTCAFRILYYRKRLAVEFFHSVTDGTGGMIFAKTLAAEYVRLKYGIDVPCECGIKNIHTEIPSAELRDDFHPNMGPVSAPRDKLDVFRQKGTLEPDHFLHDTLGISDSHVLVRKAKEAGVTVTAYLAAVLIECLIELQNEDIPKIRKQKKVKVQIPVNLRQLYPSQTMRNFAAVANVGVDPRLGTYSFEELLEIIHHQMKLSITAKNMQTIFTPNVTAQQNPFIRLVPLPIKNRIMRMVYDRVGENVSCLSLSNMGEIRLPSCMEDYVERVEFVVGPQVSGTVNCGICSYQGRIYIHFARTIKEARLEQKFFSRLVRYGIPVKIEANEKGEMECTV